MKLETTNPRICQFYKENPSLHFDSVNLLFIELFEKVLHNLNHTMSVTLQSQILDNVNEIKSSMFQLKDTLSNKENEFTHQMLNLKNTYVNDLQLILQNNNIQQILPLLEKQNTQFIQNTQHIFNDMIPKSQSPYYMQIQDSIRGFYKSISDDTRILLNYADRSNGMKEYIGTMEQKLSSMIQNLQHPIHTYIQSTEEKFKDQLQQNQLIQQQWVTEISDLLSQQTQKQVSTSPVLSDSFAPEKNIQSLLNKKYNTAEIYNLKSSLFPKQSIQDAASPPANTDYYLMKRTQLPKIFIQSVDSPTNLSTEDIQSFLHYMHQHTSHGILLSQKSGISNKSNFQIDIDQQRLILYIHNVDYSFEKIKSAIDIIDHLSVKLTEFQHENETNTNSIISKEVLDEINKDFQTFIRQKENTITLLKDQHRQALNSLDDFQMPCLSKYLSTKYATNTVTHGLKCDVCQLFLANNLKALAAHKRGCNRKHPRPVPLVVPENT